jgi:hypothetical protein
MWHEDGLGARSAVGVSQRLRAIDVVDAFRSHDAALECSGAATSHLNDQQFIVCGEPGGGVEMNPGWRCLPSAGNACNAGSAETGAIDARDAF